MDINKIEEKLKPLFNELEDIALHNQKKVLNAFKENRVALHHMAGSSGYGYDDTGKVKLAEVFAKIFNTEAAICSPNLTSGTHSLCTALFGCLFTGDKVLSITGDVYDTLQSAVYGTKIGSLKDYGIEFSKVELIGSEFDYPKISETIKKVNPKLIYIQRSAGYSNRDTLSISKIKEAIDFVKKEKEDVIVFVDNCYGTFSEKLEPTDVGADVVVGSLIKNAGGGIAPTGGYIVGKKSLIETIEGRLFGVGLGSEVGSYAYGYTPYFEGVFIAPSVVKNAIKGSVLVGAVLSELGVESFPTAFTRPNDLIRRIVFNDKDKMIKFIQKVQECSPIDSFALPEPWEMPGYSDPVIMAAGCFIQGASIEMSADGPIRPPFTAYFQGGITYEQVKIFAEEVVKQFTNN